MTGINQLGIQVVRFLCVAFFAVTALGAQASAESRLLCVYDPAGKAGDYYRILSDYVIEAGSWGVELEIKAYTDEATASRDYEAGQCDGVLATGVRLQRFNRFPSTIEAIGAIPTYDLLKQMVQTLSKYESAAKMMRTGEHETVGIIPVGAVYLFVRDRSLDSVQELAGKRIATMDYDKASPYMVQRIGAITVPADLGSIGPKFNNGDVDACYISAPAYEPFEIWRGMEPNGGILRLPLAQATLQLLVRPERFPADFGAKSRAHFSSNFDRALGLVKKAEANIPGKYWIDMPADSLPGFEELFLNVRLELRDKSGAYDSRMLNVLRKLRCAKDSTRAECVEKKE